MAERDAATAAVVRNDDIRERVERRVPPNIVPMGQCPYCHHDLERRTVEVVGGQALFANPREKQVVLEFWGCTNEGCHLMFWRHPRIQPLRVRPLAHVDDDIEH